MFLIGVFSYGFAVFNYNFGIDEDTAFGLGPKILITSHATINRWAMYAYYYVLLPGVFYPFIGNILAIFFVSLAYCMFISNHPRLSFSQKLLFCGLAISLPTFGTMLEFSFMVAQVSCSIALVVFAYLLTVNGNTLLTKWIMPIILCAFVAFTYQSLIYIFPGLFFIDCLLGEFNILKKGSYRLFCRIIVICVISLICYVVGSKILHLITGIPQSSYGENIALYLHRPLKESILIIYRWLGNWFNGALLKSFLFLALPIAIIILCGKPRLPYALSLFLIIGYFFFPFFGLGLRLPIRSWFFAPFIFAAIFLSAYITIDHRFKILFLIFSIWIVCLNSSINTKFALSDYFSEKRDQLVTSRIYNELYDTEPEYSKTTKRSIIIGTVDFKPLLPAVVDKIKETYGSSFFSWRGEHGRVYSYLNIFGVVLPPTINSTPEAQKIQSLPLVKDMPAYPAKGFIKVVDDVLVIKLSAQNK